MKRNPHAPSRLAAILLNFSPLSWRVGVLSWLRANPKACKRVGFVLHWTYLLAKFSIPVVALPLLCWWDAQDGTLGWLSLLSAIACPAVVFVLHDLKNPNLFETSEAYKPWILADIKRDAKVDFVNAFPKQEVPHWWVDVVASAHSPDFMSNARHEEIAHVATSANPDAPTRPKRKM